MPGDGVVAHIGAAVVAAQVDRLACARILVAKAARGAHGDCVATEQTGITCTGCIDRCAGVAVVGFSGSCHAADGQCLGVDSGRSGALVGDGVVAHIRAAVVAHQGDRFADSGVLVAKGAGGRYRYGIAADQACIACASCADGCAGVAVVGLAGCCNARHGQCLGGDGSRSGGLVGYGVVAYIGTAVATDQGDCFAATCVLVTKRAGGRYRYGITTDQAGIACAGCADRCAGGAVVGFTCSGNAADGQYLGCHGDGIARTGCAQAGQCIVCGQAATGGGGTGFVAQCDGADVVAGACVFAVGCGAAVGECFTAYARGDRDGASAQCGVAIVGFGGAYGHGLGADGSIGTRKRTATAQVVIARIGAAQGNGADRVIQVGADVLLFKCTIAAHGDHIAALQPGQTQGHAVHAGVAVIGLGDTGGCGSDSLLIDGQRTDYHQVVTEVGTRFGDAAGGHGVVAGLELACRAGLGCTRAKREVGCAAGTVGDLHSAVAGAGLNNAAGQVDDGGGVVGQVLGLANRVVRPGAVGGAGVAHAYQQLAGRNNGVAAIDVADGVVAVIGTHT